MTSIMRFRPAILLVSFVGATVACGASFAQTEQNLSTRKVVNRVAPSYPQIARLMKLKGTVKVEALVANNGTVKSVGIKGGHPVLAQAAADAVRKWKWEPTAHESKEPIEVRFEPEW
jgi:TonB family protein